MDSDFDVAETWKDLSQEEIYDLLMRVIGKTNILKTILTAKKGPTTFEFHEKPLNSWHSKRAWKPIAKMTRAIPTTKKNEEKEEKWNYKK
jgi:hypothetical protein